MKARLQDYRMLWRAAVTHTDSRTTAVIRWLAIIMVIVFGAALTVKWGPGRALPWFWCGASVLLLLNWGWRFMPGAVKLNTPVNAKLVPLMRRRLVELSCLVCCAGIAGIASAPFADTDGLGVALFWIVLLTVGTGLVAAGHRMGTTLLAVAGLCAGFSHRLEAFTGFLSHPLVILLSVPLYAAVIVVAVRAMFPQAGERHWDMEAWRKRWMSATPGMRDPFLEQVVGGYTRGWYAASLRRDSARRDGPRLLLHALGPSHQLGEIAAGICLMTLVLGVLGLFTAWRVDAGAVRELGWLFAAMLLFVPLAHSLRLAQMAGGRAAEQGLARLAPAAPGGAAAFNLGLGRALLRRALGGWLMASGAALALVALGGADAQGLLRMAGVCCLALPMVALPLRDHAAARQRPGVVSILLLLLMSVADLLLAMLLGRVSGWPFMLFAVLLGSATAALAVVHGLRRMREASCAFPAGRMD